MSCAGPILIPILGELASDPETGASAPALLGFVPGVHYNVTRHAMCPALAPFEIAPGPETPREVWAGDSIDPETGRWRETVFLQFPDDETARAALTEAGLWVEHIPEDPPPDPEEAEPEAGAGGEA